MLRITKVLASMMLVAWLAPAQGFGIQDVPEPLKPWITWVMADENQYQCPYAYQDFQQKRCSWPGALKLALHAKQGRFSGDWTLYRQDWLVLPGDQQHWPRHVNVNRQPAAVVAWQGKPALWLPAGRYHVDGEFFWDNLPESLAIADDSGLIQLAINDTPIAYPRIEQGALWLNSLASTADAQANSLDVQVFRQIVDDIPLQTVTRLVLQVAGKAREIALPHALLAGFVPVSLESPLPARLEADGRLLLQVRPGNWEVTLRARHPQALTQLELTATDSPWPTSELWAFQAMPALRLVEIEGLSAVDASQTNLPAEWQHLPTYSIKTGERMTFKTLRRGDPEPEPNQLNLQRKLWLDFDGGGYTVSDRIDGTLTRDWRLDAVPQTQLGQVLLNGRNQLITELDDSRRGVEVRRGAVQLQADSRIETNIGDINAVGWRQSFNRVSAELNIPPGWRLLATSGVDNAPNSWLNNWSLLDLFLVLMTALAVARLWTWQWGLLALLSLTLIWHEADAPRWIWLNVLAALALLRVLPDNRFYRWVVWYRNLSWLSLIVIVIPFMIAQIRIGVYPQLERPWQAIQPEAYSADATADAELARPMPAAEMQEMTAAAPTVAPRALMKSSKPYVYEPSDYGSAANFDRIDPDANLQTGPGLPQWHWQTVQLSWNGAVDDQQQLRLWYLSPTVGMLLHFVQALLTGLLSLRLLGLNWPAFARPTPGLSVWLLLPLLLSAAPINKALADMPDPALLEQLKTRLLQAPPCLPECAEIESMQLDAKADSLRIELSIHAQQDVAVPLPADLRQWYPQQVFVDGGEAQGLIREHDDSPWLLLTKGVHQVALQGGYAPQVKFTLPLPLPPRYCRVDAQGWRVDGIYENGKVGPQLEFSRLNTEIGDQSRQSLTQGALPAFVRVERILHLGLDWRVTTRVETIAGGDSPVLLELPLWPGEAVTSLDIRVKDGKVLVNLPAGQTALEWQSLLEKRDRLTLTAADHAQWHEIWRADVSPIWHLQTKGIDVVHHQDPQGAWLPEWRPWPGESVELAMTRPRAVAGATLTIDKSELRLKPGQRNQVAELRLNLRSSKGGQHKIGLPHGAALQSVAIDGVSQPIRQQDGGVTLPIHPGAQLIDLSWQTVADPAFVLTTPKVDLGMASVNSHIQVEMGEDRWVLLTFGPAFGPAALIWGLLAVLLLVALGLGRCRLTPLSSWQWFLLLIGISQIHIFAALVVVGWLFALGARGRHVVTPDKTFNLAQVGLAALSLLALLLLFLAVEQGLLGSPDMQIVGNQSTPWHLNWYQDHSDAQLPTALIVSAPMMLYRLLMLGWSLWMALSLLNWLRWGWNCYSEGGLWRRAANAKPKTAATDRSTPT